MSTQVEMIFWDVQHGHSTFIRTPNNKTVIIDLGTGDYSGKNSFFSPLIHLRRNYNLTKIDYLVITHPHLDHIDDILNIPLFSPTVFCRPRELTNEKVMENVRQQDNAKFEKYCNLNSAFTGVVEGTPDDPSIPDNYGGMTLTVFSSPSCPNENFNNHSIVSVIEYAGIKIVIPGDNEDPSFEILMQNATFKSAVENSHILLAPHHGRQSGYNNDFVNLVNPYLSIVSDGRLVDSSANHRYSQKTKGWEVFKKNGNSETRKCLSTNSDGEIFVKFGFSDDPQYKNFLNVEIN